MSTFDQVLAPVVFNRHLTGDYWLLEVEAPSVSGRLVPGQFVSIRIGDGGGPYLRRPFSVYRVSPDRRRLQVAYKVIGAGSRLMTRMPEGGQCDLVGPFGRGFKLPDHARRIGVVGRGIGIAALPTLVDAAAARGIEVRAFLSARTRSNLVGLDIFESLGISAVTHTDEEAAGQLVSERLIAASQTMDFDGLYVCGSNRLARAVHDLAARKSILAEVAMEQHMACGFGDCHGCVIPVNLNRAGGECALREVCHYGPVFDTWEIVDANANA